VPPTFRQSESISVIDVRAAMKQSILERRKECPGFTFAADGVYPNAEGHRVTAQAVAKAWDLQMDSASEKDDAIRLLMKIATFYRVFCR
jgi:hypothetical protein